MALIVKDRVLETCSTSGLIDFTLTGAVTGYQRFSAIGNGNTTYYAAYVIGSNDWEVGIGTVGTSSLTRDTILSSSTGSKVNFAGNPVVWCDLPSSKALFTDSNGNASATNFLTGFTSVDASGTQIVLTSASNPSYVVTGSGGQTIKLPDATTLANGTTFDFNNNQSSGAITVNNNSNTLVASIPSGGYVSIVLLSNATAAGSWDRHDQAPSNVSWSTNTFDYPGSITSATWNGSTVAYNRGGTGQSSNFVAGGVVYGSSTTALAVTAIGTSGQALLSNGASAPTWGNPTAGAGGSTTQVQYNSSGALAGSANMTFDGTKLTLANDASVSGLTVGKGNGSVVGNTGLGFSALAGVNTNNGSTAVGYQALTAQTSGYNDAFGYQALASVTTASNNCAFGLQTLKNNTSGTRNSAFGNYNSNLTSPLYNNTTGNDNAAFGNGTLSANVSGNYNSAFGSLALLKNTGSNNSAFGFQALNLNTSGTNNTAVGMYSLPYNLTGGNNTAVGYSALYNNTGSNSTAVGYQAAYSNTSGIVTAFGYQAGYSTTTNGTYLGTYIGYQAGYNATGAGHTFVGHNAGKATTSINWNTAVGYNALAADTAGTNTALGASAGEKINGANNVAIGYAALFSSTTGTSNTAIGYQAGYAGSANANTTGINNTYIGRDTVGSANNNSNETVIGYLAVGNGSNTVTIGNSNVTLNKFNGVLKSTNYTVATLPSASTSGVGAMAFVTDALAPTFGATVTGGGAVPVPVYSDGTNWKVG
jgi:hypothetical protein